MRSADSQPPPPTGSKPSPERQPSPPTRSKRRRRILIAVVVVFHLMGVSSSLDALMSVRTAPGTVAWIVSLNTFPYLAVPAYWIFGRTKFRGYVIARRDDESALARSLADKTRELQSHRFPVEGNHRELHAVKALAKLPILQGNRAELLIDGEATFDSIFAGIDAAQRYLLVQFYIVRDDGVGNALKDRLIRKAREGVQVYFLYDEIGSYRLPSGYLQDMSDAGVHVTAFHSTRGRGNRFQLNFRNHRKIVVADGVRGWLGGFNVGDEYLGKSGHWRDTHLMLEGPAALALQLTFLEDWHWATGDTPDLPWKPAPSAHHDVPVLTVASGPADRFETASLMMQQAILAAEKRVWIASPYFVPDEAVQSALKLAALGGVDVRVLIPEEPDNVLTYYAAYAFLGPLLDAGVRIFRYQEGMLHGKYFLVDEAGAGVGTVNLDNRSFRLNFEMTALVFDPHFAAEMHDMFQGDFARSREMTLDEVRDKPLWFRVTSRGAHLFAPLL
jgi:cardiolipin synthase A/B